MLAAFADTGVNSVSVYFLSSFRRDKFASCAVGWDQETNLFGTTMSLEEIGRGYDPSVADPFHKVNFPESVFTESVYP